MSIMSQHITIASLSFFIPAIVSSHHAAAGLYDREAIGEIQGEVMSVFWRNPHVRFRVESTDESGESEIWEIEGGSVNTLERVGIYADMVKVGDDVGFSGYPGRNGRQAIFAQTMTLPSGQQVPLGVALRDRYAPAQDAISSGGGQGLGIFRIWVPTSYVSTGSGRVSFPLTAKGRAAKEAWDPVEDTALRCIPQGMPGAMSNPYPIEFIDRGEEIILRLEEWDGVRTLRMNSESDLEQPARSPMGHSVGHWENDTLVVETTAIDWPYFDDLGTPLSSEAVVLERFALHPNGRRLSLEARTTDPENFTAPIVTKIEWEYLSGQEIKPYNCALPEN